MASKDNRFTIAFDDAAQAALQRAMDATNLKTMPDVIRAATAVFVDLLDVESRHLSIILRDNNTGSEWTYSPHRAGRATPVAKPAPRQKDNIIHGAFPSRAEADVPIGMSASTDAPVQVQEPSPKRRPR